MPAATQSARVNLPPFLQKLHQCEQCSKLCETKQGLKLHKFYKHPVARLNTDSLQQIKSALRTAPHSSQEKQKWKSTTLSLSTSPHDPVHPESRPEAAPNTERDDRRGSHGDNNLFGHEMDNQNNIGPTQKCNTCGENNPMDSQNCRACGSARLLIQPSNSFIQLEDASESSDEDPEVDIPPPPRKKIHGSIDKSDFFTFFTYKKDDLLLSNLLADKPIGYL
jgi:ribosomal protein L40E